MSYLLILGAKSDIAKAIARQYAEKGFNLYLSAKAVDQLAGFANDLQIRHQITVKLIELDILDISRHRELYNSLSPRPYGLICTIGYLGSQEKAQSDWDELKLITDVNYTACAYFLEVAAESMKQAKKGLIVAISSVAGDRGRKSNYAYGSAKSALTSFLSGMRNRLASNGVQVITVKPGFVYTKMTKGMELPARLTAQPEEVAKAVYRAHQSGKNIVYVRWFWKWIMFVIKLVPEFLFKKTSI